MDRRVSKRIKHRDALAELFSPVFAIMAKQHAFTGSSFQFTWTLMSRISRCSRTLYRLYQPYIYNPHFASSLSVTELHRIFEECEQRGWVLHTGQGPNWVELRRLDSFAHGSPVPGRHPLRISWNVGAVNEHARGTPLSWFWVQQMLVSLEISSEQRRAPHHHPTASYTLTIHECKYEDNSRLIKCGRNHGDSEDCMDCMECMDCMGCMGLSDYGRNTVLQRPHHSIPPPYQASFVATPDHDKCPCLTAHRRHLPGYIDIVLKPTWDTLCAQGEEEWTQDFDQDQLATLGNELENMTCFRFAPRDVEDMLHALRPAFVYACVAIGHDVGLEFDWSHDADLPLFYQCFGVTFCDMSDDSITMLHSSYRIFELVMDNPMFHWIRDHIVNTGFLPRDWLPPRLAPCPEYYDRLYQCPAPVTYAGHQLQQSMWDTRSDAAWARIMCHFGLVSHQHIMTMLITMWTLKSLALNEPSESLRLLYAETDYQICVRSFFMLHLKDLLLYRCLGQSLDALVSRLTALPLRDLDRTVSDSMAFIASAILGGCYALVTALFEQEIVAIPAIQTGNTVIPDTSATRLFSAFYNLDLTMVKILVDHGENVNDPIDGDLAWEQHTPLMRLARGFDNEAVVQYLVEVGGAHVNAEDVYGQTALHYACARGNHAMAEYLIVKGGAAVNWTSAAPNSHTPLHCAILRHVQFAAPSPAVSTRARLTTIHMMLKHGAQATIDTLCMALRKPREDQDGWEGDIYDVVRLLLLAGAVPATRLSLPHEESPLMLAVRGQWSTIITLLMQYGADPMLEHEHHATPLLLACLENCNHLLPSFRVPKEDRTPRTTLVNYDACNSRGVSPMTIINRKIKNTHGRVQDWETRDMLVRLGATPF